MKQQKVKPENRPPRSLILIFSGFLIIALFNILSNGVHPFGFVNDAFARVAPNLGELVSTLRGYTTSDEESSFVPLDSYDRCEVIDPNNPPAEGETPKQIYELAGTGSLNALGTFGGINQGLSITGGFDRRIWDELYPYTAQALGMSYIIAIIDQNTDAAATNAALFVEEANDAGLVPIIRLCTAQGCDGFENPGAVADFYRKVYNQTESEFIAMVGPNEPLSNDDACGQEEYRNFTTGNAASSIQNANAAAQALQSIRGERMFLAPGAVNIVRGRAPGLCGGNELDQSEVNLFQNNIDPNNFDFIMANVYEIPGEQSAYDAYSNGDVYGASLQNWVSTTNMQVIFTEFSGFNPGGVGQDLITRAEQSARLFCQDDTVQGLLFYRAISPADEPNASGTLTNPSAPGAGSAQNIAIPSEEQHIISQDDMINIVDGCIKETSSNLEYAWANCNFDSCIYEEYEQSYDDKSVASACAVEESDRDPRGLLLMACEEDLCFGHKAFTLQVDLPIKQFGSTSPGGTPNYNYMPICGEIAFFDSQVQDANGNTIDPLNQFAGSLRGSDGSTYPMPWLGSAINCAANLIKQLPEYAADQSQMFAHPGSYLSETNNERRGELDVNTVQHDFTETVSRTDVRELDERTLCYINQQGTYTCESKQTGSVAGIPYTYAPYTPASFGVSYDQPENAQSCQTNTLSFLQEPNNQIKGPEVYFGDQSRSYYAAKDVCFSYAQRNLSGASDNRFVFGGYDPEEDAGLPPVQCRVRERSEIIQSLENSGGVFTAAQINNVVSNCQRAISCFGTADNTNYASIAAHRGECTNLPFDINQACIGAQINQGNDGTYVVETAFPDPPTYDIPGVYDALFELYKRVDTVMSERGLRVVYRENVGWEAEVNITMRDFRKENSIRGATEVNGGLLSEYAYAQQITDDAGNATCSVPNLFTNEIGIAKGAPIKSTSYYYDWLGYIDIMQEWIRVYSPNNVGSTEKYAENIFLDPEYESIGIPDELREKSYFLQSGSAAQMTRFPMLTCDEVRLLELYDNQQRGITDPSNPDYQTYNWTCIAPRNENFYTQQDVLGDFLCQRGYAVPGVCEPICEVETINPSYSPGNTTCHPGNVCDDLIAQGKNGFNYPACRDAISVANTGRFCGGLLQLNQQFGDRQVLLDSNASTEEVRQKAIAIENTARSNSPTIGVFGTFMAVQPPVAEALFAAESMITQWENDDGTYSFPSGTYDFVSCGGVNNRAEAAIDRLISQGRADEVTLERVLSMHSLGLAVDFNCVNSNKYYLTDQVCTLDIPPEFVIAMEAQGFRWGGRFGGEYYDPMHFEWNPYCINGTEEDVVVPPSENPDYVEDALSEFTIEPDSGLVCEPTAEEESSDELIGEQCNEFNCGLGNPANYAFEESLQCAAGTLRSNSLRPDFTLAHVLDRYGPYCDNETIGLYCTTLFNTERFVPCTLNTEQSEPVVCETFDNGAIRRCSLKNLDAALDYISRYPFVANFTDVYDQNTRTPRICTDTAPRVPREQDAFATCSDFSRSYGNLEGDVEAWEYYRGSIERCGLSNDDMTWAGSVGGTPIPVLVDEAIEIFRYSGFTLQSVPREKVERVFEVAQEYRINPYLLIGIWATESWFGQTNPVCNTYVAPQTRELVTINQ